MDSPSEVEVTIVSAKDLKNVNWKYGPIRPYAVVWVDPNEKVTTRADDEGDNCPIWDQILTVPLPPSTRIEDQTLFVDVVHANRAGEDTKPLIGSARLKLREVLDDACCGERVKKSLILKRPSGRPQGKIDVKVLINDTRNKSRDYATPYSIPPPGQQAGYGPGYAAPPPHGYGTPYAAPPPPQQPSGYGSPYGQQPPPYGVPYATAPPPPQSSGYGMPYAPPSQGRYYSEGVPPPSGYPYAPSGQTGYGYQQNYPQYGQQSGAYSSYSTAVPPEKKTNKFGGMGAGLAVGAVAGALGGLALAEGFDALENKIADDAAARVEDDLDDY